MMIKTENSYLTIFVIVISLVFAAMMNVYPLSADVTRYRPMILITVLVFWTMYRPKYVGLTVAFFVGLLADLLFDTLLGQQACCAIITTFSVRLGSQYVKTLNFGNSWGLAAISLITFTVSLWILQLITQSLSITQSLWSLVISILLWPVLTWVFRPYIHR